MAWTGDGCSRLHGESAQVETVGTVYLETVNI